MLGLREMNNSMVTFKLETKGRPELHVRTDTEQAHRPQFPPRCPRGHGDTTGTIQSTPLPPDSVTWRQEVKGPSV